MNYSLRYRHRTIDLANWRLLRPIWLAIAVLLFAAGRCWADTVDITLPQAVSFAVADVSGSTSAIENPTTVRYRNGDFEIINIAIQANDEYFTRPTENGGRIAANKVSWTGSYVSGGGELYNGTLTHSYYVSVWTGYGDQDAEFTMSWTLAAPGTSVRAGNHTLTAVWKIESL